MKTFIADTNIFLRYILKDNINQYQKAQNYFNQAKKEEIRLIVLPEIIIEVEYGLKKIYKIPRDKIRSILLSLVKAPYLEVRDRDIVLASVDLYKKTTVDLVDLIIYCTSQKENIGILSFDKDFQKLLRFV